MKNRVWAIACLTVSLAATGVTAQTAGGAAAFAGQWRVTGVAVADSGVQALSDNDPSLMGKRLTFSRKRLTWNQPTATHDSCINPRFTRLGTPAPVDLRPQLRKLGLPRPTSFAIRCQSGSWGPSDTAIVFRGAGGTLALPWYDGGVLKLARQ